MIKIEVITQNGAVHNVDFESTEQDFKELIKFDNGTNFVKDKEDYYILIKTISKFRFK